MTKKICFIFRIRIEFSVLSFQNQYLNMEMNRKNYFNQCFQGSTLSYSNSESEQKINKVSEHSILTLNFQYKLDLSSAFI